jgi:Putative prokaryotic signal transducing protein
MAYCPVCKEAYGSAIRECPRDHVPLVDELPFQTITGDGRTWVEIANAGTIDEANLLQGFLEAEGIDCQVESLKFTMEPINFGTMGEIRIYVPADQEDRAIDLLRKREREYGQLSDEESVVTDEGAAAIDESSETEPEGE